MTKVDATLDTILLQIGEFGNYQKLVFGLFSIAVIFHSAVHIAFVFSAKDVNYRCEIPSCDNNGSTEFQPEWLGYAVPFYEQKPSKCERFSVLNSTANLECKPEEFGTAVEKCDSYVFGEPEITIVQDFDLYCEDNVWKLTLIGTINNIGQFVGLTISGLCSDRFGRRTVLVLGMLGTATCGIIRAFSPSYIFFAAFEFLDAAFGAGTYACGFILGVELVGPSKRVLSGTIICCCYAIGEILVALVAWATQSWRPLLLAIYIPPLLLISYFWITPESIRWLISRGRIEEAQIILRKAAKFNKKTISEDALEKLRIIEENKEEKVKDPIFLVFKSVPLLLRFINCCICWITCAFLFYGLTLNSVALNGNPYLDFILTSLVEIPAYLMTYFTVDRWGRRTSQFIWFLMTGVSCFTFIFTGTDYHWVQLTVYLLGKFGATAAFTVIYIITSEIFPTPLRHSLMGACSMFGRIGSMVSPQMPLLSQIWKPLPLVLFGIMGTISAFLSLLFPETLNTKLPDTIEEAINIGKSTEEIPQIKNK
ncbi:PREDICTED: organic cation transporter protein-like [Nicrophorus vespilloides]|uniref:Organic cation transporter protein-like n=1 Tax=Nicrophorus vespilloides TaxID=110193 RepID=A0ABM1MDD6_NICVS|nr:PREDICTED: organic cation transporter protein-like [Nicrophorus vespilloides]